MAIDPKHRALVGRFFASIKSLNELDREEIRNVVTKGDLNPSERAQYFVLNYQRVIVNIEHVLGLDQTKNVQVIAMVARSTLETATEIRLMASDSNAVEKVRIFEQVEKLKTSRRIVTYKAAHPDADVVSKPYEAFIQSDGARIDQEKERLWPGASVKHWSRMNMEQRCKKLGDEFDELYQVHYAQFSWYVHPGITGFANVPIETLLALCGVAFRVLMVCYAIILEAIVNEFKLFEADARVKSRIVFAKMLPFTDSQAEIDALAQALGI